LLKVFEPSGKLVAAKEEAKFYKGLRIPQPNFLYGHTSIVDLAIVILTQVLK
jgi:hypothetical protein